MRRFWLLVTALVCVAVAGCGGTVVAGPPEAPPSIAPPTASGPATPTPLPTPPTRSPTPSSSLSATPVPAPGTVPPVWLGTRVLRRTAAGFGVQQPTPVALRNRRFTLPDSVPELPGTGFASVVADPAPADVIARSTWAPGCPVAARDLAWLRLTFWGFDDRRHTGELLVHRDAAADLTGVFRRLYDARFPIEQMRITTKAEQTGGPTGDGNDTGAFNCRPVRGATTFSQHAYGLAVDVNPFQNPYEKGDLVLPELAGAYTDRSWERPGMIVPGGPVVAAFESIGWTWGGTWHSLKDLQHFSRSGG